MKLEIQEAIESLIPPEQLKVILDVVELLLDRDYVLALDELNTVLMIADDYADSSMLVARINDILTYALNFMLTEHGVTVSDSAPLQYRLAVIATILTIPYYIIPDDLAHIFQRGYDNEETLAQLVAFFSVYDEDEILEVLEDVDPHALNVIRKRIDERIQVMGEYAGGRIDHARIKILNKLIKTNGRDKFSMMLELANAGVRQGRSFDELLNISFESLEAYSPDIAAAQLCGLAFFSSMPIEGIWPKLDASLDEYTDNPMERRLMSEELSTIKRNLGDINETA